MIKRFILKEGEWFTADFPACWDFGDDPSDGNGGPPVSDAMTMRACILGDDGEGPDYEFNLREVICDCVEGALVRDVIEADSARCMMAIRDGLLECATMITQRLPKNVS